MEFFFFCLPFLVIVLLWAFFPFIIRWFSDIFSFFGSDDDNDSAFDDSGIIGG